MKILFILNDPPDGSERSYDGLRLAGALSKTPEKQVRVFLIADATACAKVDQKVAEGFYNIELMVDRVVRNKGQVGVRGSCMNARGIDASELSGGVERSSMDELAQWTQWADKVLVF